MGEGTDFVFTVLYSMSFVEIGFPAHTDAVYSNVDTVEPELEETGQPRAPGAGTVQVTFTGSGALPAMNGHSCVCVCPCVSVCPCMSVRPCVPDTPIVVAWCCARI